MIPKCLFEVSYKHTAETGFCKKAFTKNFAKFSGKHLYMSLCFDKVTVRRPETLVIRYYGTGVFCEFQEIP